MKQEDKELLINDLCARLKCGVIAIENADEPPFKIVAYDGQDFIDDGDWEHRVEKIRPYLFPLTSMTKEQKSYLHFNTKFTLDICNDLTVKRDEDDNYFYTDTYDYSSLIDWLNKNHFDFRGLIEKGLAIDATRLNIY